MNPQLATASQPIPHKAGERTSSPLDSDQKQSASTPFSTPCTNPDEQDAALHSEPVGLPRTKVGHGYATEPPERSVSEGKPDLAQVQMPPEHSSWVGNHEIVACSTPTALEPCQMRDDTDQILVPGNPGAIAVELTRRTDANPQSENTTSVTKTSSTLALIQGKSDLKQMSVECPATVSEPALMTEPELTYLADPSKAPSQNQEPEVLSPTGLTTTAWPVGSVSSSPAVPLLVPHPGSAPTAVTLQNEDQQKWEGVLEDLSKFNTQLHPLSYHPPTEMLQPSVLGMPIFSPLNPMNIPPFISQSRSERPSTDFRISSDSPLSNP